jgi:hypothetical protein
MNAFDRKTAFEMRMRTRQACPSRITTIGQLALEGRACLVRLSGVDQRKLTKASVVSLGRSSRIQWPVFFSITTVTLSATSFIWSAS